MKQISQNYKNGRIRLESVEPPAVKEGGVLIETRYSVVSTGTEGMKVKEGKMGYIGKARARPDHVKKVVQTVQQQGLSATYQKVMNKLDSLTPLGYSASGIITAVGPGAEEFHVGQQVACAGAGYANHAEQNFVPKNLVVAVPDGMTMEHAAFATIGAIAMQGFRQAEMQLGETACVIGLGLIGQLLVQILCAAGIRVIGIDLMANRCVRAEELGALRGVLASDSSLPSTIAQVTRGIGIDCVFICAGGNTNAPIELAVDVIRDRGRIVDIGKTRLDLPWNDFYLKELDVRFSRSYGPGRYDVNYEEKGIDYPVGYVRWTERRNMAAFLDLVATGKISIDPVIDRTISFDKAEEVYQELASGNANTSGLGVVFRYGDRDQSDLRLPKFQAGGKIKSSAASGKLGFGVIGAGNYASSMLLPYLVQNEAVVLKEVATATSLSAANAKQRFEFERTSTDYRSTLAADDIQAVVIATRHASHAPMTVEALRTGKTVYVEKPLAIDIEELEAVRSTVTEENNDRLMVGFNRRFSPMMNKLRALLPQDFVPLVMHYRVHAGPIEADSWYLDSSGQGSRFIGEAGHFFDIFSYLTAARPVTVTACCLRPTTPTQDELENVSVTVEYENGSIGNLLYLTQGGLKVPKEYLEIFGGGRTVQLHNFEHMVVYEGAGRKTIKSRSTGKGQKEEIERFVSAVRSGAEMPISLESIFDTTLTTLAAADSIRNRKLVYLADYFRTN